jgi:hypothetical protein
MDYVKQKYNNLCNTPSDINEHLPTLYKYATKCESIIELGVRGCISSWAFTYGLLNNNSDNKSILLNDITECDIDELLQTTDNLNIDVKYEWINDLELEVKNNVDLTFIDTWHIYGQLKRELNKYSLITNKYIIMHDTTVDEIYGEIVRRNIYIQTQERNYTEEETSLIEQSKTCGFPVEELTCGLGKAIQEFLDNNKNWKLLEKYTNNNGLTILERL